MVKINSKAILCCGPANAGKDVSIMDLKNKGYPLVVRECKDVLHQLTQTLFCVEDSRYWQIYNDRGLKEVPLPDFKIKLDNGEREKLGKIIGQPIRWAWEEDAAKEGYYYLSIRQAMICVSEVICKPRFGSNYFGLARANSIQEGEVIVDGSCGFVDELDPLIDKLGQENILLLRIHRNGYTFEGDSRSYIPDGVINNTIDVYNNSTEGEYFKEVEHHVRSFLR